MSKDISLTGHNQPPRVGSAAFYMLLATIAGPTAGLADDVTSPKAEVVGEATLDLDRDGTTDRAVLVRNANGSTDLQIDFGTGGTPSASRRPPMVKRDIASGAAVTLDGGRHGGLTIRYGCGGCSNDTETKLNLVYRGGQVLISGYTLDWDTRSGIGRCDVNLLTGQGFVGHGLSHRGTRIKVPSHPIALSAWSDALIAKVCP